MMHSHISVADKRKSVRDLLAGPSIIQMPGAFNPLSAKIIERQGFSAVYISGAVISAELGLPDIGLTTLTEVSARAQQISRVTDLPTLVDADTGFGEAINVARTVQVMEDAGVSGMHIEDQVNPKRCGHLDGKAIVDLPTALQRIRAAVDSRRDPNFLIVARTDARTVVGFKETLERATALVDAGADAIFPEALASLDEFEQLCKKVKVPVIANMTEFGKTELYTTTELERVGVKIVIYPVSLLRLAMGATVRGLETLAAEGKLSSAIPQMQTRADLYDVLDYESFNRFDSEVFNFTVAASN
jgi:methylisocitrate lyase